MRLVEIIDPAFGIVVWVFLIEAFKIVERSCAVFGADVDREASSLSAIVYELLRGIEVILPQAVFLQDVTPAPRTDLEVKCLT
jgi:hypothetical protein